MNSGPRVVLMTADSTTARSVTDVLRSVNDSSALEVCPTLPQLVVRLENAVPTVAVVDLDPEPSRSLKELDPIIVRFSTTRFIVLSGALDQRLIMEAMAAGARHLLCKQTINSDLPGILKRFMTANPLTPAQWGSVCTVLSAGGGCGATTVALNLANELQLHSSRPVLLVDLDSSYGAIASYLGVEGQYGVADILARATAVDDELIRTTAQSFSERLHVLLSPVSTHNSNAAPMTYDGLNGLLRGCGRAYSYTVVDAPRVPPAAAVALAQASSMTYIILQLSVKDIRVARSMLRLLSENGIAPGAVSLVVSRYHRRSVISLVQAKEALGRDSLELLCSDYRHATESMTYGQPLAEVAPRSPLRKEVRDLAIKLLEAPVAPTISSFAR
jgi:pilus assembly protein CpaE